MTFHMDINLLQSDGQIFYKISSNSNNCGQTGSTFVKVRGTYILSWKQEILYFFGTFEINLLTIKHSWGWLNKHPSWGFGIWLLILVLLCQIGLNWSHWLNFNNYLEKYHLELFFFLFFLNTNYLNTYTQGEEKRF